MNSNSATPELPSNDSRLDSFLRQAQAIIASEKGLTPACRAKLESLAQQVRLPEAWWEPALERLQSGQLDTDQLTRYEKAFVQFLASELEQVRGDVMSPRMERAALEIAADKYQLNSTRAEQLIEFQCERSGISRVNADEAFAYAKQAIVARIGNRTEADDELREQLLRIGKGWGLGPSDVDQIANGQTARTLQELKRERRRRWRTPLSVGLLLSLIVAGVVVWKLELWADWRPSRPMTEVVPEATPESDPPGVPTIYRTALLEPLNQLAREAGWEAFPDRADQPSALRQAWLQRASAYSLQTGKGIEIWPQVFSEEPSQPTLEALVRQWGATLEPQPPMSIAEVRQTYRANQILVSCLNAIPDERLRWELSSLLPAWWRDEPGSSDRKLNPIILADVDAATAFWQWNQVLTMVYQAPDAAANLLPAVAELTRSRLPGQAYRNHLDETLRSLLKVQPKCYPELSELCRESIEGGSETRWLSWGQLVLELPASTAANELGRQVLQQLGASPIPTDSDAVRQSLQALLQMKRFQHLKPLMDYVERVETLTNQTLAGYEATVTAPLLPQQIAETVVAVNAELALRTVMQDAESWEPSVFTDLERVLAGSPPNLREQVGLAIDRSRRDEPSGSGKPTASDLRKQTAAFERLADETADGTLKLLAVKQLQRIANRLPRLSHQQARSLARFLLDSHSAKSWLELQQLMGGFSRWPELVVALSDEMESTQADLDQVLTVLRLVMRREFTVPENVNWRMWLPREVLRSTILTLSEQTRHDPTSVRSDWDRLELFLVDQMKWRLQLYQNSTTTLPDDPVTLAASWASQVSDRSAAALVPTRIIKLTANPLDQLSLIEQWTAASLSKEGLPTPSFLLQLDAPNTTAGERYWLAELGLLKTLQLSRSRRVEQILKGETP